MRSDFTFKKIDSPEALLEVYKLRFQVYCKERNFFREADYPQGLELDAFDDHSVHFGGYDASGRLVGAVRLILPSCGKFPIEEHCSTLGMEEECLLRWECAEISRLTISKLIRPQEKSSVLIRKVNPVVSGLCDLMYQEACQEGIRYGLALMEEPLKLLLKLNGYSFVPIGPQVDFCGLVTPFLIDLGEAERRGTFKNPYSSFAR